MNIYSKKQRWKLVLFVAAIGIIFTSLWYTNRLVKRIANDERQKIKLWAEAVQKKAKLVKFTNELFNEIKNEERKKAELYAEATKQLNNDYSDITFVLKVLQDNTTVPVILTDEKGKITTYRNLDSLKQSDTLYLKEELAYMKQQHEAVEINVYKNYKNYLYYKDSRVFTDIKLVFDSLIKSFITEVAVNSAAVPVVYTDSTKKNILATGNIDSVQISTHEKIVATLDRLAIQNTPIEVDLGDGGKNYIFYEESKLLVQLKYYPYVQFGVIGLFLLIAYILFSTSRRAEQDQVWVGMSKETAHQLGTPLSSLMAWNDHLKSIGVDESVVTEMARDINRLNTITDRFSKIGSKPSLIEEDICNVLTQNIDYLKQRTSKNVNYELILPQQTVTVMLCIPLFDWVIENLCKNAIDAMTGKGKLTIQVTEIPEGVCVDVTDTGKGIPKSKFKTVFEPGYTTKQRGWGLGLSLCKRIIENYHYGKISVLKSEANTGTTFRILLNR